MKDLERRHVRIRDDGADLAQHLLLGLSARILFQAFQSLHQTRQFAEDAERGERTGRRRRLRSVLGGGRGRGFRLDAAEVGGQEEGGLQTKIMKKISKIRKE